MSKLFRFTSGAVVAGSLLFGVAAVTLDPAPASAQITCCVCVCDGTNCQCVQVVCPDTQQN